MARGDTAWAETLDREAEPKQGPLATKIEREGRESHAGNDRRDAKARNAERARLKEEHAQIGAEIISLEEERRKRQGTPKMDEDEIDQPLTEALARLQATLQVERYQAAEAEKKAEQAQLLEHEIVSGGSRSNAGRKPSWPKAEEAARRGGIRERAAAGDITDARGRYAQVLGDNYSVKDPYGSLARAATAEYGAFHKQQQELRAKIAEEQDPGKRQVLELRRDIEAHEYMAITSDRLAGITRVIEGREDSEAARRDDERARAYWERARELREERSALQRDTRQRTADERLGERPAGRGHGGPDEARGGNAPPSHAGDERYGARGHAGQEGARVQGNPQHNQTRAEREAIRARLRQAEAREGADHPPGNPAQTRSRPEGEDPDTRLREGRAHRDPGNDRAHERRGAEKPHRDAAESGAGGESRPTQEGRDRSRGDGRPPGRGGRGR